MEKITFPNGGYYEGEFVDGKHHGKGKMTYADGRVEEGTWQDDKFIGST